MSYASIADITESASLSRRITACAAQEGAPGDPAAWTYTNRWGWAAAPGWVDAWDSAVASDITDPGADEGVITDGMILAQTQALLTGEG